jgi:hypothetical protein
VEILTSKIRHETGDKFKNGFSKKVVEYFPMIPIKGFRLSQAL